MEVGIIEFDSVIFAEKAPYNVKDVVMLLWVFVLFGLGLAAFVDSIMNLGEIFRQVNSVMYLLVSVGLLVRTTTLKKRGRLENSQNRIEKLEGDIKAMANQREPLDF